MTNWDKESLAAELQAALQQAAEQKGESLTQAIAPVIMANLERNRVHYFLDDLADVSPEDYVWRVVDCYEKWHTYLFQIQEERRTDLWLPLYDQLKSWAYRCLNHNHFFGSHHKKQQLAEECATQAAIRLLNARFPYDTDFEPWAYVLLQHVTTKRLHQEYRETAAKIQAVDDWEKLESVLPELSVQNPRDSIEMRCALLSAIELLASDARKQIIILRYFEGWSLPQIATEMQRSESAIHKLHHDALKNLRKIWDNLRDKYE